MIALNDQQINSIKKLKPLIDSKFVYKKERWTSLNSDYKYLIQEFEDKEISRIDVINAYKDYYTDNSKGFMKAFLLTMVWGFADTGYGTHRTNNYIASNDNIKKIRKALDFIGKNEQDSLKNGFNELKRIKGLGVSYLTKILYFATRSKNIDDYALIFDIRVAAALVKLTTPKEIYEIVTIGPSSKFTNYQKFNGLIHRLAKDNQIEAEQLEMYLFINDLNNGTIS
jgi:hypothetical protein